jgi:hypothetical protein
LCSAGEESEGKVIFALAVSIGIYLLQVHQDLSPSYTITCDTLKREIRVSRVPGRPDPIFFICSHTNRNLIVGATIHVTRKVKNWKTLCCHMSVTIGNVIDKKLLSTINKSTHVMGDSLMTKPQVPRLSIMDRQYLTVPDNSASPERLFSSVGFQLVKSDLRGRLLDTTLIDVMWAK